MKIKGKYIKNKKNKEKNLKFINIFLKLSFICFLLFILLYFLYTSYILKLNFDLNGEKYIKLNVKDKYEEKGAYAKILNKNLSKKINIENNIIKNKTGIFNVKYTLKLPLNKQFEIKKFVEFTDQKPPSITLKGKNEIILIVGDKFNDPGVFAKDRNGIILNSFITKEGNVDVNKEGKYVLRYTVKDSLGTEASISRNIIVKSKPKTKPVEEKKEIIAKKTKSNNNSPKIQKKKNINKTKHKKSPDAYFDFKKYNVAIGYYNLVTGKQYLYNQNKIYYGASLIKTLDAIYLANHNMINEKTKGHLKKAISVSNNPSHKKLVKYIGFNNLRNYGHGIGAVNVLNNCPKDYYANTTVMDQMAILKNLYPVINKNYTLKSYFTNYFYNYLKINNLPTAHKYGLLGSYFHDVAIVYDKEPYIIIILSKNMPNKRYNFNQIAKAIYNYHKAN